ncbi:DUF2971 domain-containing protein [Marinimicrobium sp. ABcell2]|uniref:DUF2971 domain-containing protein n=1 Tax=Marinimicrobium sp. ABcell2 TaxID=3069751 RepID=UPI0027B38488|nr:DUF2971 domain-containing protein [Marinimicrobium sp. ABcell2]MDQ2078441.1 DUF2971 domain-containing protein [Marinimicrobium sp. ABcell2]
MPEHPDTLAKYCTADTAEKILSGRALRWHGPHLLGDPFELTHQSPLGFDPSTLLDGVIRTASAMIFARELPRSNSPLVAVIRRWRDEERFNSPEEAEEVLKELMGRMVDQRQGAIDELMADWRSFTRQLRICAFGAKVDNLASWQRYADNHRGAVIRFRCGEYSALTDPRPVQYQNTRPEITTVKEQLNAILHNEAVTARDHFLDKFLVKPAQASAEQEWRCFRHAVNEASSKQSDDRRWYDDHPFERSEVSGVYFGAFMAIEHKQKLLAIVKEHYADAKLFQAEPVPGKYEIEFVRIKKN